jgi:integrase
MSVELETVAEFLTGNRLAVSMLPWQSLRNEDVRVLRDWAAETLPLASQKRVLRELRQALRRPPEENDEQPLTAGVTPSLLRSVRGRGGAARLAQRQARLLIEVCGDEPCTEARRDAAALALMLLAGLRRKEVVELQRGDYDDDEGCLRVASKRGCVRSIVLEGETRRQVEAWLRLRGSWPGPLLAAIDPRGDVLPRGLSPSAVNRLLARRAREAGCEGVTPRDLRGRFLWQLQSASRERPRCRYYQDENGQPGWVLASMASLG